MHELRECISNMTDEELLEMMDRIRSKIRDAERKIISIKSELSHRARKETK